MDAATENLYKKEHFPNAVNIPLENISHDEAVKLYKKLPSEKPVIMHYRLGMIVPAAYTGSSRTYV